MSIKELYEKLDNLRAMKSRKQTEHEILQKQLDAIKKKAATDEDLTELQKQAQDLTDSIAALVEQEEETEAEIEDAEKMLMGVAEKAGAANARGKRMDNTREYLKSKQALEDFAGVLIANAGQKMDTVRKAWEAKLAEKGITNPEALFPEYRIYFQAWRHFNLSSMLLHNITNSIQQIKSIYLHRLRTHCLSEAKKYGRIWAEQLNIRYNPPAFLSWYAMRPSLFFKSSIAKIILIFPRTNSHPIFHIGQKKN